MAQISFTIPNAQIDLVQDAVASNHGWSELTGVSKTVFVKQVIADWIKNEVIQYELQQAQLAAVRTNLDIT